MKFKVLPIILAAMTLVSCGSKDGPVATSAEQSTSSEPAKVFEFLDFLTGEKNGRIDIFDFEDGLQVSYGDLALVDGTNNFTLNDNSLFTVNKNLEHEKSFNTLVVAEKAGAHYEVHKKGYLGTEGDSLTELFNLIKNEIVGFERAYVAFSVGAKAKWTHNLNAKLDAYFESITNTQVSLQ